MKRPFRRLRFFAFQALLLQGPGCTFNLQVGPEEEPPSAARAPQISWEKNMLSICHPEMPGGCVEVWYLEAFCRSGSTGRDWGETTIPHTTELLEAAPDKKSIRLRTTVEGGVEVLHSIRAVSDGVEFQVAAANRGAQHVDAVWAQPCIRVAGFTGGTQENYLERCFIFVDGKLTPLPKTRRAEEARYRGGQVYAPAGIDRRDVNPRPLSPDLPSNGLIGCFSAAGSHLLATAWEPYQELFQGVIVCIHSDFRLGGLRPGETKKARGKIYFMKNDVRRLLAAYQKDFPEQAR
ncbi:MAG: hypothetical protein HY717_20035 [Planctomycetes bacterium]|nr:hypothetical protein [Planctomycetota bacterium]